MTQRRVRRLLLAGALTAMLLLTWWLHVSLEPHREARRFRRAQFAFLTLGMSRAELLARAGTPDRSCRGGESVRLLEGQLPRTRSGSVDETEVLRRLERHTSEVLVYRFPEPSRERSRVACGPAYLDTAAGLDSAGRVLWFTLLRGEDFVRYR